MLVAPTRCGASAMDREMDCRKYLVEIEGEDAVLVERLRAPLQRALGNRGAFYAVHVGTVGRVGEILVSIKGAKGLLPLLLGKEDLEAGYVFSVVSDTVSRYGI